MASASASHNMAEGRGNGVKIEGGLEEQKVSLNKKTAMAAQQNIGARNSTYDAHYRYTTPKMITKIKGRGNGIKTIVVNMVEIAKALARPPSYITKYFGYRLGAQSYFDAETGASYVNGAHETARLDGLLETFINKFVQCYGCCNPETEIIIISKTQVITLKCAACGFVSDVDMMDKLTTFILNHPPELGMSPKDKKALRKAEKERLKAGEAADKEMKNLKKGSKEKKTSASDEDSSPVGSQADDEGSDNDEGGDDVQSQTGTPAEVALQRIQQQLSFATAKMVMLSTVDDDPEPKTRKKSSPDHQNGSESPDARVNLVDEIKKFINTGASASELKTFLSSKHSEFSPLCVMNALFESLFDGIGKGFAKEVAKKMSCLAAAAAVHKDEEFAQMLLLRALENFCRTSSPEAVKEVVLVLKTLYDGDVLEEMAIIVWYNLGDLESSPILKTAEPFVKWLLEESESE